MNETLTGGCLCGAVRYSLEPGFRMKPYACHCTDCQTRTGSAFSMHMLITLADLELTGETDEGNYVQPSGAGAKQIGCSECKVRIYAVNSTRPGMAGLRIGTLDNGKEFVPSAHLWVKSKQPWIVLPEEVPALNEAPQSSEEWFQLLGPVQ